MGHLALAIYNWSWLVQGRRFGDLELGISKLAAPSSSCCLTAQFLKINLQGSRYSVDRVRASIPVEILNSDDGKKRKEDPDWPEDADGWGFSLGQFFNKITIKNVKKDDGDDDDEKYDSDNEIEWQDDDYIHPIKDITTAEWEGTLFKDISPLIVLVHNRYKRFLTKLSVSLFSLNSAIQTADEFSKIMAYFYYGAAKPPCLDKIGDGQEMIPAVKVSNNQ
ncbi:unnamed protein product [Linum trigynum]|uniref:Uncharacterized protein n=1 Tax=Linum trigynum TaxID=586398 RepID=A0AAV2E1H0_9ROSI